MFENVCRSFIRWAVNSLANIVEPICIWETLINCDYFYGYSSDPEDKSFNLSLPRRQFFSSLSLNTWSE